MIAVQQWGRGPELIIALHGYGHTGYRFANLARELGPSYTLCAPDLPFHGDTRWHEDTFDRRELRTVLRTIAERKHHDRFHLLGHSLGGRIALRLAPRLKEDLKSLHLLAPDGLGGPYTAWIDYMPNLFRKQLGKLLEHPNGVLRISRFLYRRKLIDAFALKYLQYQLQDPSYRERVRGVWRSINNFRLRQHQIIPHLSDARFPIVLLAGNYDSLIDLARIERWFEALPQAQFRVVNSGHDLPPEVVASLFLKILEEE